MSHDTKTKEKPKKLPNKVFYKIGEVSDFLEIEPYVLRYWETEFKLKLSKSKNGQRLYQRRDIEQFLKVKKLLYQDRFTIAGARKKLKEVKKEDTQLSLQSLLPVESDSKDDDWIVDLKVEIDGLFQWIDQTSPYT